MAIYPELLTLGWMCSSLSITNYILNNNISQHFYIKVKLGNNTHNKPTIIITIKLIQAIILNTR